MKALNRYAGTKRLFIVGASLLLLGTVGVSASSAATKSTVKHSSSQVITIGVLASESGPISTIGEEQLDGAQIAVSQINSSGGIKALGGAKLKLDPVDIGSTSTAQAVSGAEQLLTANPSAIIGSSSSVLEEPASTVTEQAHVATCTGALANLLTTRGYRYIFQLPPTSTQLAANAVHKFFTFLHDDYPKITKIAVVYDSNPAETGTGVAFAKAVSTLQSRVKVVLNEQFPLNFTDAGPLAEQIKASGAQMIVPGDETSELELTIAALDSIGVKNLPIFNSGGGDANAETWYQSLGKDANGQFALPNWGFDTNESPAQNKILATFAKTYENTYHAPFPGQFTGEGYVCTELFAQAMQDARSSNPVAIRNALATKTFSSGPASIWPPGKVKFSSTGLDEDSISLLAQWCRGQLVVIGPGKYAAAKVRSIAFCHGPTS